MKVLFCSPEKRAEFLKGFSPDSVSGELLHVVHADAAKIDLERKISQFSFPTLVVNGRFDADVTPEAELKLSKQIPHSTFHIFERSGHLPFYEEPEAFARVVDDYLAGTLK